MTPGRFTARAGGNASRRLAHNGMACKEGRRLHRTIIVTGSSMARLHAHHASRPWPYATRKSFPHRLAAIKAASFLPSFHRPLLTLLLPEPRKRNKSDNDHATTGRIRPALLVPPFSTFIPRRSLQALLCPLHPATSHT